MILTYTYRLTGMTCSGCVAKVKYNLEQHSDVISAEISLEQKTATLTMNDDLNTEELQYLLGQDSKYVISYTAKTEMTEITEKSKSFLVTYKPLLLIFLFIAVISGIKSINQNQFDPMLWMRFFMAGFFIVFSFFKFLDLKGFANSYAMYDLLAKRVRFYGFVYPFIELTLGIAYLINFESRMTNIVTIIIMGFSSLGVIQSVIDKKQIRCACLGAVFKLPMSVVTIIENLLMVAMSGFMLGTA